LLRLRCFLFRGGDVGTMPSLSLKIPSLSLKIAEVGRQPLSSRGSQTQQQLRRDEQEIQDPCTLQSLEEGARARTSSLPISFHREGPSQAQLSFRSASAEPCVDFVYAEIARRAARRAARRKQSLETGSWQLEVTVACLCLTGLLLAWSGLLQQGRS
jgi:hypothetical protein